MAEVTLENVQGNLPLVDPDLGHATPYFEDWLYRVIEDLNTLSAGTVTNGENVGAGSEVFKQLSDTKLQFRTITSSDASVTITQSDDEIDLSAGGLTPGTVANSILTWSGSAWTELEEYLISYSAGAITMTVEDSLGAGQIVGLFDADAESSIYYDGAATLRTAAAASGGAEANNTSTGAGWERVLTASDLISTITGLTATAWRTFYSDGSGNVTELALGTSGQVLTSNGAAAAPSWQAGGGGGGYTPTVDDSILVGDTGAGDFVELSEVTMGYAANVLTISVEDSGATLQPILVGDADAELSLYHDGEIFLQSDSQGARIADPASGSDPYLRWYNGALSTEYLTIGHSSSVPEVRIFAQVASEQIHFRGDDAGSVATTMAYMDPDGSVDLYYDGTEVMRTRSNGIDIDLTGANAQVNLLEAGTEKVKFNWDRTNNAGEFQVLENSATFAVQATDAVAALVNLIDGDPDGAVELYYDGSKTFETLTQGIAVTTPSTNPQIRFNTVSTLRGIVYYDDTNNQMVMDARETTDSGIRLDHTGTSVLQTALDSDGTSLYGYYDGDLAWETYASGLQIHRPGGGIPVLNMRADTATGDSAINFAQTTNAVAQLRYHDSGYFHVQVTNTGEDVHITNLADGDMAIFNGGGSVDLYYDGVLVCATDVAGIRVIDDSGDDPRLRFFQDDNTTQMANFQAQTASARLLISSDLPGNEFVLRGRNAADTAYSTMMTSDPDGAAALYHNGQSNPSLVTVTSGLDIYDADGAGGATDAPFFGWRNADGSTRYGFMQFNANTGVMRFSSEDNSTEFHFFGDDAGGADSQMAHMDPDDAVQLYFDNAITFETRSNGISVLGSATNNALVSIRDNSDNAMARVGFASGNKLQIYNQKDGENVILYADNAGGTITSLLEADPDLGIGFNGSSPVAAPTYTLPAYSTDRAPTAPGSITLSELADVVCTIIADLQANGLYA